MAVVSSMASLTPAGQALAGFRRGWRGCLGRWADVLFELTDAVLCAPGPVRSLPRLSLEPVMGRGHGSGYAALAGGLVGEQELAGLLARFAPAAGPGTIKMSIHPGERHPSNAKAGRVALPRTPAAHQQTTTMCF